MYDQKVSDGANRLKTAGTLFPRPARCPPDPFQPFAARSAQPAHAAQTVLCLANAMTSSFGSSQACHDTFVKTANSHFGSGWCWLTVDSQGKLEIFTLMQEPKNETKWKLLREQEFVAAGKETVLYIDPLEVVNGVKVVFTQLDGTSDHFIAYDWVFREL